MKKTVFVIAAIICGCWAASAQEKGFTLAFASNTSSRSLNGNPEFGFQSVAIAPGYGFNGSFFCRLQGEVIIGLFDASGVRSYERQGAFGAALGYNLVRSPEWGIVEIAASLGSTAAKSDWSFMYYDGAVRWSFTGTLPLKMSLGAGVRYHRSYNNNFADYCNLYASIGFRFN